MVNVLRFRVQAFLLSNPAEPGLLWNPDLLKCSFFFRGVEGRGRGGDDRLTITRDGAMGNETFYWDGLSSKSTQAQNIGNANNECPKILINSRSFWKNKITRLGRLLICWKRFYSWLWDKLFSPRDNIFIDCFEFVIHSDPQLITGWFSWNDSAARHKGAGFSICRGIRSSLEHII